MNYTKCPDEPALPQALPLNGKSTDSNIEQVETMLKLTLQNRLGKHISWVVCCTHFVYLKIGWIMRIHFLYNL